MDPNVARAVAAAPQVKGLIDALGGPKGVLGRIIGLGEAEIRGGVPGWAILLVGASIGGVVVWTYRGQIERIVEG
jgi:hypothetical protein